MTIAVNVTLTIESNKANYIVDLSSTLSHSFQLILSVLYMYCQLYLATYYFEIKEIKKHSRHQVFLFVLIQHPLFWTLILTSQISTPEYLTSTGELFSEVDRNVVCYDYDSTILGGSYYSVTCILFQRFHV